MPAVRDRVSTIPRRDLPVRVWGEDGSPPLLLLHGLFGNSGEWDTVAERLAEHRQVFVPDQRGHGIAAWATDYTAPRLVSDVADLVEGLGLTSLDLVGHSMGGIVAMLYAAQYGGQYGGQDGGRVRTLSLLDIGPDTLSSAPSRAGFLAMLDQLDGTTYDDLEDAVTAWQAADPLARREETASWARRALRRRDDGRWAWRVDTRGIGGFLRRPPAAEMLWCALDRIDVPTLVLYGEHSWALSDADARRMTARLRRGSASRIAGAGHDLGVQAPHAVADHLVAFIGDVDQDAPTRSARRPHPTPVAP